MKIALLVLLIALGSFDLFMLVADLVRGIAEKRKKKKRSCYHD